MNNINFDKTIFNRFQYIKLCSHGGRIEYNSKNHNLNKDMIDYSISLNPLGSLFEVNLLNYEKISKQVYTLISEYPDNSYTNIRNLIVKYLGIKSLTSNNIIIGNGSTELISFFCHSFLDKNDKVIIQTPTFGEYEHFCSIQGSKIIYIKENDILNIDNNILNEIKCIFLCNPNNPTGYLHKKENLILFLKKCDETNTIVFIDEAFIELTNLREQSLYDSITSFSKLFILRSLTKSYSIPGIRLGFAIASKEIIDIMNKVKITWNIGCFQEVIFENLLSVDKNLLTNYLKKSNELIQKEKKYLHDCISRIYGLKPELSETCFMIINIDDCLGLTSKSLTDRLIKSKILVRDCSSFSNKLITLNAIRIGIKSHENNKILVHELSNIVDEQIKHISTVKLKNSILRKKENKNISLSNNSRLSCQYYPCHFYGQDCTYCYCLYYPCLDSRTGGKYILSNHSKKKIWSCASCKIIHIGEVSSKITDYLMKDENSIDESWEKLIVPLLSKLNNGD